MRRIISALLICFSSWALAQATPPLELAPDAPERHVVVPGDTLWGISALFLKDPFRWPEIWRLNAADIKNPHWIYPGQVVVLDRSGEQPQLKIGKLLKVEPRIYAEAGKQPIPAIPQKVIEPFLSQPLVVEAGTLDGAARIVAFQGGRISVGAGDTVYVTQAKAQAAQWQVFRAGKPMLDPDSVDAGKPEVLGFEATYLGTARQVKAGEPATFEITSSKQEIDRNDYLLPTPPFEIISYVPHAPAQPISGRIIKIYGGVGEGGKFSIVSLSRGKRDGLEIGHVLAIYRTGAEVSNLNDDKTETYKLPEERYGLLFVFRVFDRVAYGLIMDAPRPVMEGDTVRNP
ncbi:MAG: LysM peptidoglycan-binding domain-containing protein [Rhodocyclaceae bacterium]|nr:LysM peptidoglycan-binding domain-containing protein [Rhodocyclaceae bacterium]